MSDSPIDPPSLRFTAERYLADVGAALGFFSRIPVARGAAHGAEDHRQPLAEAVRALPVAAVAIALGPATLLVLAAALGFSPTVAAVLAIAALVAVTGALHEDGLADIADGFWGGRDKARILEIMRDSRIGTFGTLALVLASLLRVALIAEAVAAVGAGGAALLLIATAVASRTVLLYPWVALPPARRDGLAATYGSPRLSVFRVAVATGLALSAVLVVPFTLAGFLAGAAAAAAAASLVARLSDARIGGHTGDVLGATQQLGEIAFLAGVLIFLA